MKLFFPIGFKNRVFEPVHKKKFYYDFKYVHSREKKS